MKKMTKWLVAAVIVLAAGVTSVSAFAASDNFNRPNHQNEKRIHKDWQNNCPEHLGSGMFTPEEIIEWENQREERRAENRQQRTNVNNTKKEDLTEWENQREERQSDNRQQPTDVANTVPEQEVADETADWGNDNNGDCYYGDGTGNHQMGNGHGMGHGSGSGMHNGGGNGQGMGRHHGRMMNR